MYTINDSIKLIYDDGELSDNEANYYIKVPSTLAELLINAALRTDDATIRVNSYGDNKTRVIVITYKER
jgi:hypothetical protein